MKQYYKLIDHTADLGIKVFGSSKQELFQNAALAFCDLICDRTTVQPVVERRLKCQRPNDEELLHAFLSELLYYFDTNHELYSKIEIEEFKTGKVAAKIYGEKIDPQKHDIKTGIKAVTYHLFKIEEVKNKWQAQIIFDV